MADRREIRVPAMGLVLLVGISGSGKTTFAAQHFLPSQVISSDFCRALVSDDESDQSATADAFDVLNYIVGTRLRRGKLTVVDATNVQSAARKSLIQLAKDNNVLVDAIVLDVPESVAQARNANRALRQFNKQVIARQERDLRRSLRGLRKEGFRRVHVLTPDEVENVTIVPEPSWNDRSELSGPFDIIGDVHGCYDELLELLEKLGWQIKYDEAGAAIGAQHPAGRTAIFVGDLVDRGPNTPGVLRLVMGMVAAGTALCVSGNHEAKLLKYLRGQKVSTAHGLAETAEQLAEAPAEFRAQVATFLDGLISHYVLDGGRLVVAHAGLKEEYHGRSSARVRAFALYGDTTGESDEFGLPVRLPWAREYRGKATVVYGHTPVPDAEWINNTICIDTGAVFGGKLTALRYPERELVAVSAKRVYADPIRPLVAATEDREPTALRISDVTETKWLDTTYGGRVKIPEENAATALEVMSRFAIDPRWLIYLPPTMSPAPTSAVAGFLEYPTSAFDEYAALGVTEVVCEEKHMGSRAVIVLAKDSDAAKRRFGVSDGSTGAVYTRTGRAFFPEFGEQLVERTRQAVAPLFETLNTDWLALDCELLPWSARALDLIKDQFAAIGAAAQNAFPAAQNALAQATRRGLDVTELTARLQQRAGNAEAFRSAYAQYVSPTDGLVGVSLAPFQILAAEGEVYAITRSHRWHLDQIAQLTDPFIAQTRHRFVDLASADQREAATQWWLEMTANGGEGMVVKPVAAPAQLAEAAGGRRRRFVQPGLKVRGREYLRIIYGPDYLDSLDQLRNRSLGRKQNLAMREYGLGLEALQEFVAGAPLWQVHQHAFAVLALESEPVDPRL